MFLDTFPWFSYPCTFAITTLGINSAFSPCCQSEFYELRDYNQVFLELIFCGLISVTKDYSFDSLLRPP